jgi:hypothetical protein
MEIQAGPLDWTANDEEVFAKFLDTPTGKRLFPKIVELTPQLLAKGDVNEILIRSGEVRGIGRAVDILLQLAHPAKNTFITTNSSEYPPLEADEIWNDGQKLTPPEKSDTEEEPPIQTA